MKDMFDECELGNLKLKSRVIRTGIWERETENGGFLKSSVFERYDKIAKSGVGAIISEMFVLDPRDRFYEYSTHTNYKGFIKDYKEITDLVHSYNVSILGQLSFFFYNDGLNQKVEPNDISIEGIRKLQAEVIMFAKKLSFAGFDGIQLNLGNNFYLSRFTNPYFNNRKDNYGGNTYNRMRIVLEIIKILKESYDLHISCKVNPVDVRKGGMTEDESIDYTKRLIDAVNTHVILGGTLRDYETINTILNSSDVEFVSMSKPFTAQGDFFKRMERKWCRSFNLSKL